MTGDFFDDIRNAPARKPSAKRAKADRANIAKAWQQEREKRRTTLDALDAQGVDFGIEMDGLDRAD